jgi:hypothetical protein
VRTYNPQLCKALDALGKAGLAEALVFVKNGLDVAIRLRADKPTARQAQP